MSWMGLSVTDTKGDRNRLGAKRDFDVGAAPNNFKLVESLLRHDRGYDGSYGQSFDHVNSPVIVPGSNGAQQFNGYWVRLDLKPKPNQKFQTDIEWNTWSCLTGNPFPIEAFHEAGFKNLTSVLEAQGKIKGPNTTPFSVIHA
ncbi:MAG: hypothetical protein M1823_003879 [Watsoniomyces obsoletus]|nr:MAG: hypothetical protein M1823_003879 [Watsoniomyces obsoletus]